MSTNLAFLLNQADKFIEKKNYTKAKFFLLKIIKLQPNNFHATHSLGIIFSIEKNYTESVNFFEKALNLEPKNELVIYNMSFAYNNLANYFKDLNKYNESLSYYDKAININPNYSHAWNNKGNLLKDLMRYEEAIIHYDHAIKIDPKYEVAWNNKGNVLKELGHHQEALNHYKKAIEIKPNYEFAWNNKGIILKERNNFKDALACFNQALAINANYSSALNNKGNLLRELKNYEESFSCYYKAYQIDPNINYLLGNIIQAKSFICDWKNLKKETKFLEKQILSFKSCVTPLVSLSLFNDSKLNNIVSTIFSKNEYPLNSKLGSNFKINKNKKIKIGYYSNDFREHPVANLAVEMFELHNRDMFEIIAFSFCPPNDGYMQKRLKKTFDQFIEVYDMTDFEVAKLSRDLNIDIAVDLMGYTLGNRTGIFALRAAPIQVNYLGFPGTMGCSYIDYVFVDKIIAPRDIVPFFSEKIVYLPNCYQPNDSKKEISKKIFSKNEMGIPSDSFVFCCFNNNYKITPDIFDIWMNILKNVDNSILWLLAGNQLSMNNLQKEAKERGVDPKRIIFANFAKLPEHLSRHSCADLFLDTFPYNAHTTASDALFSGLPLITKIGNTFASRVGASLLNSINLPELITDSFEQYESLAVELATNPSKLQSLKKKLLNNRMKSALFDSRLFTKNIESAYKEIYTRYENGLIPDHINI